MGENDGELSKDGVCSDLYLLKTTLLDQKTFKPVTEPLYSNIIVLWIHLKQIRLERRET